MLVSGLRDAGACGLYGTGGWQPAWLPLFRRACRVYVALDRGATDRAIALARTFGTRGRVLIPPEELGPRGDLNDWLRVGAKGDPAVFRTVLERALAMSPTPWALQIQRLPSDLAPWDLEDYPGVRDLLCEVGHHGRSVAMRTCDSWRSGTGWHLLLSRKRPANWPRTRRPSHRCPAGASVVILTNPLICPEDSLTHHFVKFTPILTSFKVETAVFLFTLLWPDKKESPLNPLTSPQDSSE